LEKTILTLKECIHERERMEATGSVYCELLDQYVGANFCAFMCRKRSEREMSNEVLTNTFYLHKDNPASPTEIKRLVLRKDS